MSLVDMFMTPLPYNTMYRYLYSYSIDGVEINKAFLGFFSVPLCKI